MHQGFCTLLPVEGSVTLVYSVAHVLQQSTSFKGVNLSVGENDTKKLIILCISLRVNKPTLLGANICFLKARTE